MRDEKEEYGPTNTLYLASCTGRPVMYPVCLQEGISQRTIYTCHTRLNSWRGYVASRKLPPIALVSRRCFNIELQDKAKSRQAFMQLHGDRPGELRAVATELPQ